MKDSLTDDQCARLEAFLRQTPKRPDVFGVMERIYDRENSECEMDTSSTLPEDTTTQEQTLAPVTYRMNRDSSVKSTADMSRREAQTSQTTVAGTSYEANSSEIVPVFNEPKHSLNEVESGQPKNKEASQPTAQILKPWKSFFQYPQTRKSTQWRRFLILEKITYSPCFTGRVDKFVDLTFH